MYRQKTANLIYMEQIRTLSQMVDRLRSRGIRRRVAVVCPNDPHTEYVIIRSLREGIAEYLLVTDEENTEMSYNIHSASPDFVKVYVAPTKDDAAAVAVELVRLGEADVLMKGLINTDNLLRAVLNKEHGLLPHDGVLSHIALAQIPLYHKLLFFSDAAVIPQPTYEQFRAMVMNDIEICRSMGCEEPRVALVHCSEKVSVKFPHTLCYTELKKEAVEGKFGKVFVDGPMDAKTACDKHSGEIKGISSPVVGNADILIFPNIESGNTFYKTISLFGDANIAGMLTGTVAPVVVPSRSDSGNSKYYSLVLACLVGK